MIALLYTDHARRRARARSAPLLPMLPEGAAEVEEASSPGRVVMEFRHGGRRWRVVLAAGDVSNGVVVVSVFSPDVSDVTQEQQDHFRARDRHRRDRRHKAQSRAALRAVGGGGMRALRAATEAT